MQPLKTILLFVSILIFSACTNEVKKPNAISTDDKTATTHSKPDTDDKKNSTTKEEENLDEEESDDLYYIPNGTSIGIFEDATVYAASTDFAFTIKGQTKLIRVDNEEYFELEKAVKTEDSDIPADLLDPSDDLEGPPGGNPKYIGKSFEITIGEGILKLKPIK